MISEELREAIIQSGQSAWQLGQALRINPQTIRKFLRAEVGLSQDVADRLSELLDLTLVKRADSLSQAPKDWERRLKRRAREMAAEMLDESFHACLDERVKHYTHGEEAASIIDEGSLLDEEERRKGS